MPTHRMHSVRQDGLSPMWHAPLRFPIPAAADPRGLALHVLLRAERAFGDRDVGEVFVPVQDLFAAVFSPAGGEQRHLSYQMCRPMSGRKWGVLHISYSLTDVSAPATANAPVPRPFAQYMQQDAAKRTTKGADNPVTAYPPYHHQHHAMQPYHGHHTYGGGYHHPYGCGAVGPSYGYGPAGAHVTPYGYGAPSAGAAPGKHGGGGGMGAGLGLGLLGGAVGGMMLGDVLADSEMDAAYDAGFADGIGMDGF